MKSWIALIKREYLEHRGAFVYFPLGILALFTLAALSALSLNRIHLPVNFATESALKFYDVAYFGVTGFWWLYLMAALFFYFADAFSADRRNNSMFFWKSMPVSDFKMLASKLAAAGTLFSAIIFAVCMATGLLLFVVTELATLILPRLVAPSVLDLANGFLQISLFGIVHLVLSLLWYAPFFAWVGALSTVFRRWSMALAFVIPAILGLLENVLTYGTSPRGGYVFRFLGERLSFGLGREDIQSALLSDPPIGAPELITRLLGHIDWLSMAGGLVFTFVAIYAASEYRRRSVTA